MTLEYRHFILIGLFAFLFLMFFYTHVVRTLQISNHICELALSINDECKAEGGTCERDRLPSFKKMLDACEGLGVDWGDDD
jgi:hypothetical protein